MGGDRSGVCVCGCGGNGRKGDTGDAAGIVGADTEGSGTDAKGANDVARLVGGCTTDMRRVAAGLEGSPTRTDIGRREGVVGDGFAEASSGSAGSRRMVGDVVTGEGADTETSAGAMESAVAGGLGSGGRALTVPDRARERGEGDGEETGDGVMTALVRAGLCGTGTIVCVGIEGRGICGGGTGGSGICGGGTGGRGICGGGTGGRRLLVFGGVDSSGIGTIPEGAGTTSFCSSGISLDANTTSS